MSVCVVPLPAVHWGRRAETSNGTHVFHIATNHQESVLKKTDVHACIVHT